MSIWKFTLEIKNMQRIFMPRGAKILSVANQNGSICLWAIVDRSAVVEERNFGVFGTGHDVGFLGKDEFLDTVFIEEFVWHVFEFK